MRSARFWASAAVVFVCGGVLGLTAWWHYRLEREKAWSTAAEELRLVGQAKLTQLLAWRQERINDALFLSRASFVALDVAALLERPGAADAQADVRAWLTSIKGGERYAEAILFDAAGEARLNVPEAAKGGTSAALRRRVVEVVAQPRVVFTDLAREAAAVPAYFEVLAPIFAPGVRRTSAADFPPARPIAVVVLRVRPEDFVLPLLETWPRPSRSGLALLVRREGEHAVFLNPRYLREGAAFEFRRPLAERGLVAARALRGEPGALSGIDHRGEPVLAFFLPLPDSAWSIAVKIDQAEIAAAFRPRTYDVFAAIAAIGLAVVGGLGWFWRGREAELLRRELASEAARRQSDERFQVLAAAINEVFWVAEVAPVRFVYVSPAVERVWGRTRESLAGSPDKFLEIVHPDDRARVAAKLAAMRGGPAFEHEYRVVRLGGEVRWVRDRAFPLPVDGADEVVRVVGIAEDITERRELEQQFRQAQKMEALGTLAGGIAHDFNNILASINGYAALAKMAAARGANANEYCDEVLCASARAAALVRQILAFSRRQEQSRTSLQLGRIVAESLQLLRATIPTTIEFEVSLPKGLPNVVADPTQVHQILMNLGTNAWHAMRERKGVLGVRLEAVDLAGNGLAPAKLKPGQYVCLQVSDTGHGMDPVVMERIFEPFFTTKPPGEGTGLGLSVVHGIVRAHDGDITVESAPGAGTRFRIYLPAAPAEPEAAAAAAASVPRGQGERVLLVDDEEPIVRMERLALQHYGYVVEAHTRPAEALAVLRARAPEFAIVVTDYTMPGMTGIELAAEVARVRPGLPVVLTSGYPAMLTPDRLRAAGVNELIQKPTTVDALGVAVHRVLHGTRKTG